MDPINKSVPNWQKKILNGQHIEDNYNNVQGDILQDVIYSENFKTKGYCNEWSNATGYGLMAVATKTLFAYLGASIQARRQFIPGYFFFANRYFSWIGGAKYIIGGYLVGSIISSFTVGQPFLLEDLIRRQYRKHSDISLFEKPTPQ